MWLIACATVRETHFRWRPISKKIWAYCGKMCKSIQSLLFPLRTCTRAAQCSKVSMNCMAQLLLTAFDLIQVNFLGFNLFLLLDPKVKSDYNTFLKRECKIYEKLQWNIVAAELSNLRSFPNLVSNKFARCVLWWMIKAVFSNRTLWEQIY